MRKRLESGFTLLEVFVCVFAVILCATIVFVVGREVRSSSYATLCSNNLRQISLAVAAYYNDYNDYPAGLPDDVLSGQLDNYLDDPNVFLCPEDRFETVDSYTQFYVYRGSLSDGIGYLMGCPRHRNNSLSHNVFGLGSTQQALVAEVIVNGDEYIYPGETVDGGTISLEDGSLISSAGTKMMLVQSFRQADGTLYSIVRVPDGETGQLTVDAIPGSRLDIVTPSAIAAIRGTTFVVDVSYLKNICKTKVGVSAGAVMVIPVSPIVPLEEGEQMASKKVLLVPGQNITVHNKKKRGNKKKIKVRVDKLVIKIDKGFKQKRDMRREVDLLEWLVDYYGLGEYRFSTCQNGESGESNNIAGIEIVPEMVATASPPAPQMATATSVAGQKVTTTAKVTDPEMAIVTSANTVQKNKSVYGEKGKKDNKDKKQGYMFYGCEGEDKDEEEINHNKGHGQYGNYRRRRGSLFIKQLRLWLSKHFW